jgi:hypothetical protein
MATAANVEPEEPIREQLIRINRAIHPIDMAKDLKVNNQVKPSLHAAHMKFVMNTLFWRSVNPIETVYTIPPEVAPIGDEKDKIIQAVTAAVPLGGRHVMAIIRGKHVSGHDTRPIGMYLAQDNGPTDIIIRPKYLLTPGSVLDPAGKTKEGADIIEKYTGGNATLDKGFIELMGMDTMIDGPVTFSITADAYTISMKVFEFQKAGEVWTLVSNPFTCHFTPSTFKPIERANNPTHKYFAGNETKNTECAAIITAAKARGAGSNANFYNFTADELNIIRKYLIMKEVGDSLQIQWLRKVFKTEATTGGPIKSENTAVGTTDNVVEQRSILNFVGVIRTDNTKVETNYTLPRSANPDDVKRQLINKLREEFISNNVSVINLLKSVRDSEVVNQGGTNVWVNGAAWTPAQKISAISILDSVIEQCTAKNQALNDKLLDAATTLDYANSVVQNQRFKSPFVWYKGGGYYKTLSLRKLYIAPPGAEAALAGDIKFNTQKFTQNNHTTIQAGGKHQKGGNANYTEFLRIYNSATGRTTIELPKGVPPASYDYTLCPSHNIFNKNRDKKNGFLYCYVRDFHPEIFRYAYFAKLGLTSAGIGVPDSAMITKTYVIAKKYFKNDTDHWYNKGDVFRIDSELAYTQENFKEMWDYIKLNIQLAELLIVQYYPSLCTSILGGFFLYCNAEFINAGHRIPPLQYQMTVDQADDFAGQINPLLEGGGGEQPSIEKAMNIAIQAYANEFDILMKHSIKHKVNDFSITEPENKVALADYSNDLVKSLEKFDRSPDVTKAIESSIGELGIYGMKNKSSNIKNYSNPSTPFGDNSNTETIVSNASSVSLENNWRAEGGKSRYRKTQKRKSSRKQTKRKTRRHKK